MEFLITVASFAKQDYNRSDFHLKVDFILAPRSFSHDVMKRWSLSLKACIYDWNCCETSLASSYNKIVGAYVE